MLAAKGFYNVTRRVRGYTRFVEKYVTSRRKRFRTYKVYILLNRINTQIGTCCAAAPNYKLNKRNG